MLLTAIALGIRAVLEPVLGVNAPLLVFVLPVVVSAWLGGFGPGMLSTVLSLLFGTFFFIEPRYSVLPATASDIARMSIFAGEGVLVSLLSAQMHRTQAQLVTQQARLEAVIQQMPLGFVLAEAPSGRLIAHNDEVVRLLRHPLVEAVDVQEYARYGALYADGQPYLPDEYPVARALLRGEVVKFEQMAYRRGDGTLTTLAVNAAPIRDAAGQIVAAVSTIHDIGQQKRVEQALRTSETRLAGIIESAMDAIISVDAEQRIVVFNTAAEHMLRCRAAEVVGQSLDRFVPPQFRERHRQHIPAFGRTGVTSRSMHSLQPLTAVRADGEVFPIEASISQIVADGQTLYTVIIRDITERKRAEDERTQLLAQEQAARIAAEAAQRRLEVLAEVSRAFAATTLDQNMLLEVIAREVAEWVGDGCAVRLLSADGQWLESGMAHHPEPDARAFLQRMLADERQRVGEGLSGRVAQNGKPVFVPQIDWSQTQAAVKPEYWPYIQRFGVHSAMMVPIRVQQRVTGVVNLVRDRTPQPYDHDDLVLAQEIADRAALILEHARLYQAAQAALHMREVFLSIAAHELKTPLTAMLGYALTFKRRAARLYTLEARDQRMLHAVTEQGERLNRLIDGLLDVSRIQLGRFTIERAPVDVCALLQRIVAQMQTGLEQHTLTLKLPDCPCTIQGDELRLEQVVLNLVQNAVKYSPAGGAITIRVDVTQAQVMIAVRDTGIGIPASALTNLFHQFYRADNVDPRRISGLGIGLYVVNQIVTLHGGTITVDSHEGRGSTFTIALPVDPTIEIVPETAQPAPIHNPRS